MFDIIAKIGTCRQRALRLPLGTYLRAHKLAYERKCLKTLTADAKMSVYALTFTFMALLTTLYYCLLYAIFLAVVHEQNNFQKDGLKQ